MKRYRPPSRGSKTSSRMVRSRGPNHCTYSSGSTWALNTNSRGASNSRAMTRSCLPGSAVMLVLFMVRISFLELLLLDFQDFIQGAIARLPTLGHLLHPPLHFR